MPVGYHCPQCHNVVKPEWSLCPNCGHHQPEPRRVRCRVCGRRAIVALRSCPHCGAYLEPRPLPVLQFSLGTLVLAGIIVGLFRARPVLSDGAERLAVLINPPTSTATITTTATATVTPTHTLTPRPSPTLTPAVNPTTTVALTSTQTPTLEPTETPTVVPVATATPTITPTPTPRYGKPVLMGPESDKLFGHDDELVLRWKDMGPLGPNETYAVRITWLQNGQMSFGGHNLRENFWTVPPEQYWGLADASTGREYEWFVFVEEITTDNNGQQVGRPVSEVSDRRTFMWQ